MANVGFKPATPGSEQPECYQPIQNRPLVGYFFVWDASYIKTNNIIMLPLEINHSILYMKYDHGPLLITNG